MLDFRLIPGRRLGNLRSRALTALALGLVALGALTAFTRYDEDRIAGAQVRLAAAHQLAIDAGQVRQAMLDERAGIQAYADGGSIQLLSPYLLGSAMLQAGHENLGREARGGRVALAASRALAAADTWQTWAERYRDLVGADGRNANQPQNAAEGDRLFANFQNAQDSLERAAGLNQGTAAASLASEQRRHGLVLIAGTGLAALALFAVALALVRQTLMPIERLAHAAEELAAGRPASQPFAGRSDEVGRLARSLTSWQRVAAEDKSVFERAPIGICRVAPDGRLLDANPALLTILGLDPLQLGGLWFPSFTKAREPAQHRRLLLNGDGERRYEVGGEQRWCRLTVARVLSQDGSLNHLVAMLEDVTLRKQQEEQLRHQAGHDHLTGLPNRRLFADRLRQALLAGQRTRTPSALLLIDLDGFKAINDQLGHAAGDEVLREVAHRLRAPLRAADTVARLGGDEFAVLLPGEDAAGAENAARKLLVALEPAVSVAGTERSLGASIGGASTLDSDPDRLLAAADAAMYLAKRSGGGYRRGALPEPAQGAGR